MRLVTLVGAGQCQRTMTGLPPPNPSMFVFASNLRARRRQILMGALAGEEPLALPLRAFGAGNDAVVGACP